MALNYITLVLDLADGTGTPLATGQALLNPSAQLTDATDDMIVTKAQLSAKLAGSYPQARLLATDNTALRLQDGRGRSLSPGRRGTLSRSRSSSRPALTLSPRPAPARPCSLPSAAPMPTARRSCSPGRRCPAGSLAPAAQELQVHIGERYPDPDNQAATTITRADHAHIGRIHQQRLPSSQQTNPSRVVQMTRKITYITCMRASSDP